jgi:transketolase
MNDAKSRTGKGNQCVCTEMGNGVDFMMYSHAWHGKPNDAQLKCISSKSINLSD